MKSYLLRGVPQSLQFDGWWLGSPPPERPRMTGATSPSPQYRIRAGALIVMVTLADLLIWQVAPGLSLVVFGLTLLGLGWALAGFRGTSGLALALLFFLPMIEQAQTLSFAFWLAGLALGAAWIALARFPGLSGGLRFVLHAPETVFDDARRLPPLHVPNLRAGLTGWLLPLGLGLIFLSLFSHANPLLASGLDHLFSFKFDLFNLERLMFWLGAAFILWPFLSLATLRHRVALGIDTPRPRALPRLFNEASIRRSLLLFNMVFAAQTLADLAILWGGAALPAGMSYAQYAHRGAYPLLVAALLAGGFALAARPFTLQSTVLRVALMGWLLQTLFLVVSSLTRLESYISAYGLTHLRIAALIWIGLVGVGITLVIWQVFRHHSAAWMLKRCALLGVGTLYTCSFFSFSATIAEYNLSHDVAPDFHYICSLDSAALPAITGFEMRMGQTYCPPSRRPELDTPKDWREWGFRDWRTARSLSKLTQSSKASQWPTY